MRGQFLDSCDGTASEDGAKRKILPDATTPDLARSENSLKAEVHGRVNSARCNHVNRERINLNLSPRRACLPFSTRMVLTPMVTHLQHGARTSVYADDYGIRTSRVS